MEFSIHPLHTIILTSKPKPSSNNIYYIYIVCILSELRGWNGWPRLWFPTLSHWTRLTLDNNLPHRRRIHVHLCLYLYTYMSVRSVYIYIYNIYIFTKGLCGRRATTIKFLYLIYWIIGIKPAHLCPGSKRRWNENYPCAISTTTTTTITIVLLYCYHHPPQPPPSFHYIYSICIYTLSCNASGSCRRLMRRFLCPRKSNPRYPEQFRPSAAHHSPALSASFIPLYSSPFSSCVYVYTDQIHREGWIKIGG